MESEMVEQAPDLDDERFRLPEATLPQNEPEALFDSSRSYMTQLAAYKAHQRRPVELRVPVAEFVAAQC
jgi:hypothetical protein